MIKKKRILAVIQARGGSKGIRKKNIYPLNGHPLISYTITAAIQSKFIDDLIIFTDSNEIKRLSSRYGAKTPIKRPKYLSGDKVFSVKSLRYVVREYEKLKKTKFDYIIELPCISPFRDSKDIDESIKLMRNNNADSVISMVETGEKHPTRLKKIIKNKIFDISKEFPEKGQNSRRQDLKPNAYIRNGAIYLMKRSTLINHNSRSGTNSLAYIMPANKSINIDTIEDLKYAEYKILNGECNNNPEPNIDKIEKFISFKDRGTILISAPFNFLPDLKKIIINNYNCIFESNLTIKKLFKLIPDDIEVWICNPSPKYKIDNKILKKFKNLKMIITPSTGINHIDMNNCLKKNIKVESLKDKSITKKIYASSEFAFGLILSCLRNIPQGFEEVKKGNWRNVESKLRSIELKNKTLGIVGFGRIGSNCAKYAKSMGLKVLIYDPYKNINTKSIVKINNLKNFLNNSDIILIAVHLNNETKNMVNYKWFRLMKKNSYLINISRGDVLNEEALIKNLKSKKIVSAAVDVIKNEDKDISKNVLVKYAKKNDNLIITPHIAGLTLDSEYKAAKQSLLLLKKYYR
jgi:D-3-phosphoglycerate dehydrogenase